MKASPELEITSLTLYAFSSDNWRRPETEVSYADASARAGFCAAKPTSYTIPAYGSPSSAGATGCPSSVVEAIEWAEVRTAGGRRLHLRVAVDYSARDAILSAAISAKDGMSRESIAQALAPDVDLLIRTGGEQRLSDFLLWECAYAELIFTPRMWPDFDASDLRRAVEEFRQKGKTFRRSAGQMGAGARSRTASARWLKGRRQPRATVYRAEMPPSAANDHSDPPTMELTGP